MNLLTDPVISATLACALSLLLALAGAHKLRAPDEFRATLEAYAILPVGSTGIATRLLPLFELAIAIALLHPQWRAHAACGAAALLGGYTLVVGIAMANGRRIADCGCSFGTEKQAVQWALVWRNLFLALIATGLTFIELTIQQETGLRALTAYDLFTILLSVMFVSAIYSVTNILIANHYRLQELLHD